MRKLRKALMAVTVVVSILACAGLAAAAAKGDCDSKRATALPPGHFALIAGYADAFLSANNGTGGLRTIFAASLVDGIDDPNKADELADFYVIDVRSNADYQNGHIPGAVNIPLASVASPAALASLPSNKPLLVTCATGHTASIATAVLATLGYDVWTLRFGMISWKPATTMAFYAATDKQYLLGGNYPMVKGPNPF